ncbi:sugar transport protein 8-like [Solanum tuberosum]|uniref:sugar transport protein 8-like n=1 Tax=Solanum tuberosum TaxID=4113 RepID=UPI00073A394B|nr:PREDICTED: sugar transport protein 8-like [Solanum tuberosum]
MNNSKITLYVMSCWIFAAFGGLMFGYDIGISGGVSAMDDFLIKFFPHVYQTKLHAKENNYCKYDNWLLQLFTSSLYISALFASFFASKAATKLGRKITILIASIFFIVGAVLSAVAENKLMLIFGRILFGVGVGFGNETVPLFLTEVAPIQHRGAVNIMFQLFVTIGIFIANLVNYGTSMIHPNGWRMSLGFAAIPAVILFIGSFVITDTPTSLVERGNEEQGKSTLMKIRGVSDVEAEYKEIVAACEQAKQQPSDRVFRLTNCWIGLKFVLSVPDILVVDLNGDDRIRKLERWVFILAGVVLAATVLTVMKIFVGEIVSEKFSVLIHRFDGGDYGEEKQAVEDYVKMVIKFILFALLASALHLPILALTETRTTGFAFAVSTNMLFTSIIAQLFLTMLCTMKAYIFFFFSGWIVVMGLFVFFFLPETKGVPIDSMVERVWMQHPIWKRLF